MGRVERRTPAEGVIALPTRWYAAIASHKGPALRAQRQDRTGQDQTRRSTLLPPSIAIAHPAPARLDRQPTPSNPRTSALYLHL